MAEFIDMNVNINLENLKKRCSLFLRMFFFGGMTWGFYIASLPDLTDLVESRSIVYFFWGSFCMLFMVPVMGCLALGIAYLAFAKSMQPPKFFDRTFTIVFLVAGEGLLLVISSLLLLFFIPSALIMSYVSAQARRLAPITPGPKRFASR